MIRILHVIGIMNVGGAETMIMNYYRHIDREKIQFDFVENSYEPAVFDKEITELGGRIFRCPHYNGVNHFEYTKWWNDFFSNHKGEFAAVHGHLGSTAAIYLGIAKKYGIYTIAHSHNIYGRLTAKDLVYRLYSYPTRYIADCLCACSDAAGISRFGKSWDLKAAKTCYVIYNAIDIAKFIFDLEIRNSIRAELGIDNKFVIGHVGRFEPQKNHKYLLNLFYNVHNAYDNTVLLLIGDGYLRSAAEQQAAELGIKDSVLFLGVRDDINKLLNAMDLFVFPSLYEGLGIAAIEAQANGLDCVCSTGVPEIAKITNHCFFIDIEEPSAWKDRIKQAVEENSHHAEEKDLINSHYDIRPEVERLEELYLSISAD